MARTRKNAWVHYAIDQEDPLYWYEIGVAAMKARPINDPKSWRWQAAVHAYYGANSDPLATATDQIPGNASKYWTRCQHDSWFFLPWHRMYLHHVEQVLLADIKAAGGPADWALPYWNYSRTSGERRLPARLRNHNSALYNPNRSATANSGRTFSANSTGLSALRTANFSGAGTWLAGGGFGGPQTGFSHSGQVRGDIDNAPHGTMHMAVGGWMTRFHTAALDPIFYLHHANIDRLWEVWLQRDSAHTNPTQSLWLNGIAFDFIDASGAAVTMHAQDVLSTAAAPLDYIYDDTTDPLPSGMGAGIVGGVSPPNLIGASPAAFTLGTGNNKAQVPTQQVAGATLQPMGGSPQQGRIYLQFENITGTDVAPSYDVYVALPAGADPANHSDHYVGTVSLFGLVESTNPQIPGGGSGLTLCLEITEQVIKLRQLGSWDPANLDVEFVKAGDQPEVDVRIGRISLYAE